MDPNTSNKRFNEERSCLSPIQDHPLRLNLLSRRHKVNLTLLLNEKSILMDLKGADSNAAIAELGALLAKLNKVKHGEDLVNALLEREQLSPTAIGHGVAIPHAKTEVIDKLACCIGLSKQGVDFKSNEPVKLVFAIVSP